MIFLTNTSRLGIEIMTEMQHMVFSWDEDYDEVD